MTGVNDVFIQHLNGLPFFARCYGGDYCIKHSDHTLVTGFFSALHSFRSQFKQDSIKLLEFEELRVIFEHNEDILVVLTLDCTTDLATSRKIALDILDKFLDDCSYNPKFSKLTDCEEFYTWLDSKFGVSSRNLQYKLSNQIS